MATMRKLTMGAYEILALNGATIPPTGPNGNRGSSLYLDNRTHVRCWMTVENTGGNDGQLFGWLKKGIPGVAEELARRFGGAFCASLADLLGEAPREARRGPPPRRLAVCAVEDPNARSFGGVARAARFAKAAVDVTPGSVFVDLLRRVPATATVRPRRGDAARLEPGSLYADSVALAEIRATDAVVLVAEDTHAPMRAALEVLNAVGIDAVPVVAFRCVDSKYPYATQSLLDASTRSWRQPASGTARARRATRDERRATRRKRESERSHRALQLHNTILN